MLHKKSELYAVILMEKCLEIGHKCVKILFWYDDDHDYTNLYNDDIKKA